MNKTLSKKQIMIIIIIAALLLILPLALLLVRQRQEVRKEAAGTGDVQFLLEPAVGQFQKGNSFAVEVKLKNVASVPKTSGSPGVDLKYDPTVFSASSVSCGGEFPSNIKNYVEGDKIFLSCTVGGTTNVTLAPDETKVMGSFQLEVKNGAVSGDTEVVFARTNLPEQGTYVDISGQGVKGTYTILGGVPPTATPTPEPGAPQVEGICPQCGKEGSSLIILGANFGEAQSTVKIGGKTAEVKSWSDKKIIVEVPAAVVVDRSDNVSSVEVTIADNVLKSEIGFLFAKEKDYLIPGDFNCDGGLNSTDLAIFAYYYTES